MSYVTVRESTKDHLYLRRDPSLRSWAILVGVVACGFSAAFYSDDYLLWKLTYISGAVFVALSCMEDWEDCLFDKVSGTVRLQRKSLIQKLFQATEGHKIVVDQLNGITSVTIEKQAQDVGPFYCVMLNFSAGYSLPLTETATAEDNSVHEQVANKIRDFLEIQEPCSSQAYEDERTSSSSDDGFERIDEGDLELEDTLDT